MITFLPVSGFYQSSRILDYRRLGKQRVECYQLIRGIEQLQAGTPRKSVPWANHPAFKMWENDLDALKYYSNWMILEWIARGYKNNLPLYTTGLVDKIFPEKVYASHRSNLLRKDPVYYGRFGWTEPNNIPYVWPI